MEENKKQEQEAGTKNQHIIHQISTHRIHKAAVIVDRNRNSNKQLMKPIASAPDFILYPKVLIQIVIHFISAEPVEG